MPQQLKPYVFNSQAELITRVLQIYFVLILIPLIIIMSHQVLQEKQSGLKAKILESGVSPLTYWISWWIFFLFISCLTGAVLGVAWKISVFYDASTSLVVSFFCLVCFSSLTLVWAVQPLCYSTHQSALLMTFCFFMLLAPHALIDQKHLTVPAEDKQAASISAMVAAKETLLLLTQFSSAKFGLDFSNYGTEKNHYSVKLGFEMLALDSLIYFLIGCALEAFTLSLSSVKVLGRGKGAPVAAGSQRAVGKKGDKKIDEVVKEAVQDQSKQAGLDIIEMRITDTQAEPIYLSVGQGEICCLTGTNQELVQRANFLKALRKQIRLQHG